MIAKRIMAPKGGAGFQRLGAYVLNVQDRHRSDDPASWGRLNAYILDAEHEGEKVAWARVTNCASTDPGWAVKEITATQGRNTRSRRDKSYHLVVSFPEGERPTREQMEDIEDRLCEAIGLAEHQRVSAVHQNTDNWHLHIALSSVHPVTFRNVAPFQDHFRLQEACAELELKHGLAVDNHTTKRDPAASRGNGRAADVEARQGSQSFLAWVRQEAAPALLVARDAGQGWQELHQAAAAHGLTLKLRGAGLVVGHTQDRRLHVKASDVDRGLSLKALTDVLGSFEPAGPAAERQVAGASYTKPERQGALYEVFKLEREAAARAQKVAALALREQHRAYAGELATYYRTRMKAERASGLGGVLRRDSIQHVASKRREDHTARIAREAEERRQVREAHGVLGWQAWLEAKASEGNAEALATLRGRQQRAARLDADVLAATDAGQARHLIYPHLRPAIRRNGAVIYRVRDGGMVADEANQIRVTQATTTAALLALTLAADRFGDRPLVARGTEDFRHQVAILAGQQGLSVTFEDRALEAERQSSRGEHGKAIAGARGQETENDAEHGR